MNDNLKTERKSLTNEHLANERTLLAWVRTGIGIMAFGFVVVKFSLFTRQIGAFMGAPVVAHNYELAAPAGITLVVAGALALVFGVWRYWSTERQLRGGAYTHSSMWLYIFVAFVIVVSIVLIIYLARTL
jgi:putative membrane protein